ncbi:unnamed protein product [Ambrosiozyma monospora]|uniref:Unnamed protein product n=1 Tax=Ambrosiozyma monospora TaxID=43982 RepID=A0ACB5TBI2_AMBMO|nr:unnamed protein product [Ambrosiozyma monospora]
MQLLLANVKVDGKDSEQKEGEAENNNSGDQGDEKPKRLTPEEHYSKIIKIIEECAVEIAVSRSRESDPESMKAISRAISHKTRFCLNPLRYGKVLLRQQSKSESPSADANAPDLKRKADDTASGSDLKRPKV